MTEAHYAIWCYPHVIEQHQTSLLSGPFSEDQNPSCPIQCCYVRVSVATSLILQMNLRAATPRNSWKAGWSKARSRQATDQLFTRMRHGIISCHASAVVARNDISGSRFSNPFRGFKGRGGRTCNSRCGVPTGGPDRWFASAAVGLGWQILWHEETVQRVPVFSPGAAC